MLFHHMQTDRQLLTYVKINCALFMSLLSLQEHQVEVSDTNSENSVY